MASLMGQLMAAFVSQANFFSPKEFDQLQNHAVDMEMVIIPYKQMDIAVMMDDVSTGNYMRGQGRGRKGRREIYFQKSVL